MGCASRHRDYGGRGFLPVPGLASGSAYWQGEPTTDFHFLIEADRFCHYLPDRVETLPPDAQAHLAREHALVAGKLAASRSVAGRPAWAANS